MSKSGTETSAKKAFVNFSRPRAQSRATADPPDASSPNARSTAPVRVRSIDAFHQPSRDDDKYPAEPRFSPDADLGDEQRSGSDLPASSAASEWACHNGPGPGPRPLLNVQSPSPPPGRSVRQDGSGNNTVSSASDRRSPGEGVKPSMPKGILKYTSVEQYSERVSSDEGESTASHHTVSDAGSYDRNGKWTSSEFDTSMLSEKEIRKLEKKGINPSLYLEMKMARKGKSFVGGLTGNAYVS